FILGRSAGGDGFLAGFSSYHLVAVMKALAFVWLGFFESADLRGNLTHHMFVVAFYFQNGIFFDIKSYSRWCFIFYGIRKSQSHRKIVAFFSNAETHTFEY